MARILVIDDEQDIRFLIEKFLVRDGHEVDLAENGKQAMKLIEVNNYDLLITDVVMPEKDGIEVLNELQEHATRIKTIVISGGGARGKIENYLVMAKLLGADWVLPKPLDFSKLQIAVNDILKVKL